MRNFLSPVLWVLTASFALPQAAIAAEACGVLPAAMRAARIHAAGGPDALRLERVPLPQAGPGDVLVKVHYASVNPVDWKLQLAGRLPFPATPGGDFSGEVVGIGAGVAGWRCGQRVAGIVDQTVRPGSYAEYVSVSGGEIVAVPAGLGMAEASAFPTVAVATHRFLVNAARVQRGERVLVHGGAGGVGSVTVQVAKSLGAYVIATASAGNRDFVLGLGADEVIDYRAVRFEDAVSDIDVVIDTVGGETSVRSEKVLKPGGRLVTVGGARPVAVCVAGKVTCPATPAWDVAGGLAMIAPLLAAGEVKINIDRAYPLEAAQAAQEHNQAGHTRGKVVISMLGDERAAHADAAAKVPLDAYLAGHATGLESHFRRAFAKDAVLTGVRDGVPSTWAVEDYIRRSASGQAPRDEAMRRRRIVSLTVNGDVATGVIELDYPHMKAFDHMSLLKRDGEWRIVAKVYDARTPEAAGGAR